jgi:L-ascorbate metabolism protein UlaG (beta-lactamase superfamily)
MDVTWIGHATVRISMDGTTLLTDPALRPRIALLRRSAMTPPAEAFHGLHGVLISHAHHDHLDLPSLRLLDRGTPVLVPVGAGSLLARAGFAEVKELAVGDSTKIGSLLITAVRAQHAGLRLPLGPYAAPVGYLIEGSQRAYFAGDTALFAGMSRIAREIDLALIPVGGWSPRLRGGHLDPSSAAQALALLRPRRAIPIHWGTFWPIGLGRVRRSRFSAPGMTFQVQAARLAPYVEVRVLTPGEHVRLDGS